MYDIKHLKNRLTETSPIHDSPIGLFHPYWARKPQNVVNEIINCLTKEGDSVIDPFMGSGTTVFGAINLNRAVFGSDLSPLSVFIVKSIIELGLDPIKSETYLDEFLQEFSDKVLPWFTYSQLDEYIERERYKVIGNFKNGDFKLSLIEVVTKKHINNKWTKRKVYSSNIELEKHFPKNLLRNPIDFQKIELIFNSRIAIPEGANLSHYFSPVNIAAINLALTIIDKKNIKQSYKHILKLLLSSAFPLLRLSDKKASSQWPYWRPKDMLTSRNPVIVLEERAKLLKDLSTWISNNFTNYQLSKNVIDFFDREQRANKTSVYLKDTAIQKLPSILSHDMKFNLVFTDPPYADQVPYLEYASMWIGLLELKMDKDSFKNELVISDSPFRKEDTSDYSNRITAGFDICSKLVADDGYIVWYYLDYDIKNWNKIIKTAQKNGIVFVDVITIKKQRRSMKTVTSPGKTLDGDMISIFRKMKSNNQVKNIEKFDMIEDRLRMGLLGLKNEPLIIQYAFIIKFIIENNILSETEEKYKNIKKLHKTLNK